MSWPLVKLVDVCNPKQWKTIPVSELSITGYTVYGANGIIGYYSKYTHEHPTLMITCRGVFSALFPLCVGEYFHSAK